MFKKQMLAVVKIGEKILLVGVGAMALALSVTDPRFDTLRLGIQISGGVSLAFGLAPMVWEYIKANYPTKKK